MQIGYVVVFVAEMERSLAFYRDGLGLTPHLVSESWCEFATEGGTLALHAAATDADGARVPGKGPGTCRPGLAVADLDAFHAAAIARGVSCVEPPHSPQPGARLALYEDSDGLVVSVAEAG